MSQHGYSPPCKMDTSGAPHEGEVTIDLLIETLTGTAFEMTVSPLDTIATIKSKIHRIEGIPVAAQHLLYNLHELEDNARLLDCSIKNGATLKLVTSMRGGPISNRRFMPSSEERAWMDLVDANRCDNILEHLPSGQLTVLVFCEGEQLNLFRVVENVDGTYSPVTDPVSSASMRNVLSADEPEAAAQRLHENTVTMSKVQDLQRRLSKGMRRRKNHTISENSELSKVECTSQAAQEKNASSTSKSDLQSLKSQISSHPSLQMTSSSKSALPLNSSRQSVNLSVSSSYLPASNANPADLLQCSLDKHICLPPLEVSSCLSSPNYLSSAPKSFLPALSIPRAVKKDSAQLSRTISSRRQSQLPSLNPVPRSIPPPLHAPPLPRRPPPPQRPQWNQRQRPPVLQQLQRRLPPIVNKHYLLPSSSVSEHPSLCQTQGKIEPITLPNLRARMQLISTSSPHPCKYLSHGMNEDIQCTFGNNHQEVETSLPDSDQRKGRRLCGQHHSVQRKITWVHTSGELPKAQKLSSLSLNCGLVIPHPLSTCLKERFTGYLSASLSRCFSLRFPSLFPEPFSIFLSFRLTEQLHHFLRVTISDTSLHLLSAQLSDHICNSIGDCLLSKTPKDRLGQALLTFVCVSQLQGIQFNNGTASDPQIEMLLSWYVTEKLCSIKEANDSQSRPTVTTRLGKVYSSDSLNENIRETFVSNTPRFCSAPNLLSSQNQNFFCPVLANLQPKPLSLRLTDSSLYQRRGLSEIPESRPQCPCQGSSTASSLPPSVLLNTFHSGHHSIEYVQRFIESTVNHISQPDLQQHFQGEEKRSQIVNRLDQVSGSLAVLPLCQESAQIIGLGSNFQSTILKEAEQDVQTRDLITEHGDLKVLSAKMESRENLKKISKNSHFSSMPSKLTASALNEGTIERSNIDESQDEPLEERSKKLKKPHHRCCQCRKKLTISNKYMCRCQKLFCSVHRYSESHNCSYNYKEEGRKLLQLENPQVMAEKIVRM